MILPQDFIKKVKQNTDLVKLVNEYTNLHNAGADIWQGKCPHPNHKDENPSFTVWEKSQTWCCYGCHVGKKDNKNNYGSDCIAFIQWIKKMNFQDAVIFLAKKASLPLPNDKNMVQYKHNKQLSRIFHKSLLNNQKVLDYLYLRGLDINDAKQWCLGYDGCSIVFPLYDRYRNILGFSRRKFKESVNMPKYKNPSNSEIFKKKEYFYGIHNLDTNFDEIRITEGPIDVIAAHKYGVKNIVALQGTALTKEHMRIIKSLKMIPVLCLDSDNAGNNGIRRCITLFNAANIKSKILKMSKGLDIDDLAQIYKFDTEKYIISHSVLYSQFLMQDVMSYYNTKLYELKVSIVPQIKEILKNIENKDEKIILLNYVKERTGLDLLNRDGSDLNDMLKVYK